MASRTIETSAATFTVRCLLGGTVSLQVTETPAIVRQALHRLDCLIERNLDRPDDAHRALDALEAWGYSTARRARDRHVAAETNVGCDVLP